jgi:hypothetical protein
MAVTAMLAGGSVAGDSEAVTVGGWQVLRPVSLGSAITVPDPCVCGATCSVVVHQQSMHNTAACGAASKAVQHRSNYSSLSFCSAATVARRELHLVGGIHT